MGKRMGMWIEGKGLKRKEQERKIALVMLTRGYKLMTTFKSTLFLKKERKWVGRQGGNKTASTTRFRSCLLPCIPLSANSTPIILLFLLILILEDMKITGRSAF